MTNPIPRGIGQNILFVDDEPALIQMAEYVLEEFGYKIHSFTDSSAALAAYRKTPGKFDVVVTDQRMPKLMGIDLAEGILEIDPDAKIIITTGYADSIPLGKVTSLGIQEVLYKPNSARDLLEAIHRALF